MHPTHPAGNPPRRVNETMTKSSSGQRLIEWPAGRLDRRSTIAGLGALLSTPITRIAHAQAYPTHPIRIIHPFSAGSATDFALRLICQNVAKSIGQNIVVENKPGAGGTLGVAAVKNATPDGYTLGQADHGTLAVNVSLMRNLPYDPLKDFEPITRLWVAVNILLVPASSPAKSVADLVALAKQKPGGLSYASAGVGSGGHLLGFMTSQAFGTPMVHVPYPGAGAARADMIAGRVDMTFAYFGAYRAEIESGSVRPLAIASLHPLSVLPKVPTMKELGFPSVELSPWFALVGPRGLSPDIVAKLNAEFKTAATDATVSGRLEREQGFIVSPSTPDELREQIKREIGRMAELVKSAGLSDPNKR